MNRFLTGAATLAALLSSASFAWAQTDEIVVTGTRIDRFQDEEVPAVFLKVRPDFVTDRLILINDAREDADRGRDLMRTLDTVMSAARRRRDIELSAFKVFEDDASYEETVFVVPVPDARDDRAALIEGAGREDTDRIELLIKTPVDETLTFEAAEARLTAFADGIDGAGRTTVFNDEEYAVSVRDLQRHRTPLLQAVAGEAQRLRVAFGGGAVTVEGLEDQVRYVRTDLLELTIYFPYRLTAELN